MQWADEPGSAAKLSRQEAFGVTFPEYGSNSLFRAFFAWRHIRVNGVDLLDKTIGLSGGRKKTVCSRSSCQHGFPDDKPMAKLGTSELTFICLQRVNCADTVGKIAFIRLTPYSPYSFSFQANL
jgi:hypothetical protein